MNPILSASSSQSITTKQGIFNCPTIVASVSGSPRVAEGGSVLPKAGWLAGSVEVCLLEFLSPLLPEVPPGFLGPLPPGFSNGSVTVQVQVHWRSGSEGLQGQQLAHAMQTEVDAGRKMHAGQDIPHPTFYPGLSLQCLVWSGLALRQSNPSCGGSQDL